MPFPNSDKKTNILLIEDNKAHIKYLTRILAPFSEKFLVQSAQSIAEAKMVIPEFLPNIVILDINLPDGQGQNFIPVLVKEDILVIVLTSHGDEKIAVEAMKAGAADYLVKSSDAFQNLPNRLERALREWELKINHRQAVEALAKSENRYRQLVKHSSFGIIVLKPTEDNQFILQSVNDAGIRMSQFDPKNDIGKNMWESHPEFGNHAFGKLLLEINRTEKSFSIPRFHFGNKPDSDWFEIQAYKLPSGEIVVIYDDISNQIKMESQRALQEAQLQRAYDLINKLNRIAFRVDSSLNRSEQLKILSDELENNGYQYFIQLYKPIDLNKYTFLTATTNLREELETWLGETLEEYNQRNIEKETFLINRILGEKNTKFFSDNFKEYIQYLGHDWKNVVKDQEKLYRFWGKQNALFIPLRYETNTFGVLYMSKQNIGEADLPIFNTFGSQISLCMRKAALHEEIQESEIRFRELFNNSNLGIIIHRHEEEAIIIQDINLAAEKLFEQKRSDLIGKHSDFSILENSSKSFLEYVNKVKETGKPVHLPEFYFEMKNIHKWIEIYIYKLPFDETVSLINDITLRIEAEKARQRNKQQLNRTNQLIQTLTQISIEVSKVLDTDTFWNVLGDELKKIGIDFIFDLIEFSENDTLKINNRYNSLKSTLEKNSKASFDDLSKTCKNKQYPILREVLKTRKQLFLNSYEAYMDIVGELDPSSNYHDIFRILGNTNGIWMPLFFEDKIFCIAGIFHDEIRASDLPIFNSFSTQISLSLRKVILLEQVKKGRENMQKLSNQLMNVQEEEKKRLARELHDEIGQNLTGIKLTFQTFLHELKKENEEFKFDEGLSLIDQLTEQVENISLGLHPSILDDLGLLPTLNWHIERFHRFSKIDIQLTHQGLENQRFDPNIEINVFRIIQEALTNVARHTNVKEAFIDINVSSQQINFSICDHGKGIPTEKLDNDSGSFGMNSMKERATLVGGKLEILSTEEKGTIIRAEIPRK